MQISSLHYVCIKPKFNRLNVNVESNIQDGAVHLTVYLAVYLNSKYISNWSDSLEIEIYFIKLKVYAEQLIMKIQLGILA